MTPSEGNAGNEPHGPGGMDGMEDEPVREPADDDGPRRDDGHPP
jgi:hypothetical protein